MQTTVTPIRIEAASLAEMVGNCERVNCAARTSYLATALRFTQAHQFHGRVLPVCLLGHTLLLLLDGHKMNHAEQEHKGPMRLGLKPSDNLPKVAEQRRFVLVVGCNCLERVE